jgi:hypothetical protein
MKESAYCWPSSRFASMADRKASGLGIAPAQTHLARGRRRLQPGHLGLHLGMFAEVEVDEVALAEGLVGGPSAAIVQARTALAGVVPSLAFGIGHRVQDVVAVDAEHQPVVVAGQDGAGAPRGTKDLRHAVRFDAARQIHHIAQMQVGLIRVALQRPLEHAAPEQRHLGWPLGHLDIGVDRTVVVMQRMAGGQVLLRVAHGDEGRGQRQVASPQRRGLRRWPFLRHEPGAAGQGHGNNQDGAP